jgi:hypothetical protein
MKDAACLLKLATLDSGSSSGSYLTVVVLAIEVVHFSLGLLCPSIPLT